ncbi:mitogen-activated protein kinase kinase kinase 18-like [Solanum dulcamara]|uniref:mitogen-activated protein kinase kinase kinase 18-like n=1 Tax=Solanum dulcamara TaxID=45834 RepID=UPI002486B8AE|nr:mitogen-activated protein kinase kinase kinase 18-like [Solanum dulcamara]
MNSLPNEPKTEHFLKTSRWIDPAERDGGAKPIGGTLMLMAPEVARGEVQGCAADIWGLGCTIIEMATGRSPWTNVTNAASLLYRIAFSGQSPEIPKFLSLPARKRWTAKELLKHSFLEESNLNSMSANQDFMTSSPTSILDQDIWNESEIVDSTIFQTVSSPLQRIRQLGLNSGELKWRWNDDERWITVRSNCS